MHRSAYSAFSLSHLQCWPSPELCLARFPATRNFLKSSGPRIRIHPQPPEREPLYSSILIDSIRPSRVSHNPTRKWPESDLDLGYLSTSFATRPTTPNHPIPTTTAHSHDTDFHPRSQAYRVNAVDPPPLSQPHWRAHRHSPAAECFRSNSLCPRP